MSQRTAGLYRLTQISRLYSALQKFLGGERTLRILRDEVIRPKNGLRVLDLGCGHASIRPALGDVDYVGIDLNPGHIARAMSENPGQGRFHCGDFASLSGEMADSFDLVMAIGLLHHLDDIRVQELAALASGYLKAGGRFLAIDPAFIAGQHWVARFLARRDSGENVRNPEAYRALIADAFPNATIAIRHDVLKVPYTHCILEGFKAP